MYESEVVEKVQDTFEEYREAQSYKEAIRSTDNNLQLSKASVTSYLPYKKGVYFPSTAEKEKISVIGSIRVSSDIHSALFGTMAYTVILCFSLLKTGSLSKQIFGSH